MSGKLHLLSASLLAIACYASPVYAQLVDSRTSIEGDLGSIEANTQASANTGLTDIVVTARRVTENAQSIPVAVSALSGAQLENKSIRDLKDIGQLVPNLFIRDGPQNPNSAFIVIRGQAQPDQPITIDSTVGLYIDGVNYPHAFGVRANMIDIERIEVLRGPQGTLYGKNTTGGAFSVITRSPGDEFGFSVEGQVGNYQSYGTSAALLHSVGFTPRDENITQEFQLIGDYDRFNYVFGLCGSTETGDDYSDSVALRALTNSLTETRGHVTNKSLGAFVQATWHFIPNWSLTGGFRYTSERKGIVLSSRTRSLTTGAATTVIPAALQDDPSLCTTSANVSAGRCTASNVNTFSKPSWLISLDHKFTPDVLAYAKASHSFRGGGQNIRGSGLIETFAPFKPEVVTEYEVGFKSEFFTVGFA
jgi:outer membrane receptor protein involved in Fe transport